MKLLLNSDVDLICWKRNQMDVQYGARHVSVHVCHLTINQWRLVTKNIVCALVFKKKKHLFF